MTTFTGRPGANGDDGYSWAAGAGFLNTVVYIGGATVDGDCFLRIPNVTIPQGATISAAKLTFKAKANQAGAAVLTNIYMDDIDNAVAPTDQPEHGALNRTTAFTAWDNEGAWTTDTLYDSPDFTSAVQEVVDRGSWASGNAMQVLIDNDGSGSKAYRHADEYNTEAATSALLTIEYTTGVTATPTPGVATATGVAPTTIHTNLPVAKNSTAVGVAPTILRTVLAAAGNALAVGNAIIFMITSVLTAKPRDTYFTAQERDTTLTAKPRDTYLIARKRK